MCKLKGTKVFTTKYDRNAGERTEPAHRSSQLPLRSRLSRMLATPVTWTARLDYRARDGLAAVDTDHKYITAIVTGLAGTSAASSRCVPDILR